MTTGNGRVLRYPIRTDNNHQTFNVGITGIRTLKMALRVLAWKCPATSWKRVMPVSHPCVRGCQMPCHTRTNLPPGPHP
jgi:hypothetical protein